MADQNQYHNDGGGGYPPPNYGGNGPYQGQGHDQGQYDDEYQANQMPYDDRYPPVQGYGGNDPHSQYDNYQQGQGQYDDYQGGAGPGGQYGGYPPEAGLYDDGGGGMMGDAGLQGYGGFQQPHGEGQEEMYQGDQGQYDKDNQGQFGDPYDNRQMGDGDMGPYAGGLPPPPMGGFMPGEEGETMTQTDYSAIPDVMLLNHYCASARAPQGVSQEAREEAAATWVPVREWLRTHSAEEVRVAAQQVGDSNMTALHLACRHNPPADVIDVILSIAGETAQWQDQFAWLPIHYACAAGAETKVIQSLVSAYPESRITVDRRGRTPLHFALGNSNPGYVVKTAVVVMLSASGAASYEDENGMLPLHYACAYGAPEEALYVLTDAYPDATTTMDKLERTPLHFALSNAGRKAAPAAVRLLLNLRPELINVSGGGKLPLRVLAEYAPSVKKSHTAERESVLRCLEHLLSSEINAENRPTPDFFTALQALPDWLQERAVVMPFVQKTLNQKIALRFPTAVLLCDFFVQILVLSFYAVSVPASIEFRFDATNSTGAGRGMCGGDGTVDIGCLIPLYVGASYFFLRTLVQILSLMALSSLDVWFSDPSNWLDIIYIVIVYFWAVRMGNGNGDRDVFRTGTALSVMVLWLKLLAFLRNTYVDIAVFLGGLFYVVRRLVAFLLCLCITLIAFSQMFFTLYRGRQRCRENEELLEKMDNQTRFSDLQCERIEVEVYCDRWDAFLNSFTMLLGEVDDNEFKGNNFAIALFILFMFLVVILLANVLIAIVTDSYKVIQEQRAAIVFWSNRLDFIAEMDAVANGPWKTRLKKTFGLKAEQTVADEVTFGKKFWDSLQDLFRDEVHDEGTFSVEFLCHTLLRIGTALIIVPCWLFFGLLTFGTLWPPQIRQLVFQSVEQKHSSDTEEKDEQRKTQVKTLQQEVYTLKDDLLQELAVDRTQVVQMKSQVAERKQEIQSEMKHIKRIVAMLFEQQSST